MLFHLYIARYSDKFNCYRTIDDDLRISELMPRGINLFRLASTLTHTLNTNKNLIELNTKNLEEKVLSRVTNSIYFSPSFDEIILNGISYLFDEDNKITLQITKKDENVKYDNVIWCNFVLKLCSFSLLYSEGIYTVYLNPDNSKLFRVLKDLNYPSAIDFSDIVKYVGASNGNALQQGINSFLKEYNLESKDK